MNKKKKRAAQLSSLNRAFAIANRFQTVDPSEFKLAVAKLKEGAASIRKSLGFSEDPTEKPKITLETVSAWNNIRSEECTLQCIGIMRNLIMDVWYKQKRVFYIPEKTIKYIMEEFPFIYLPTKLSLCLTQICSDPIYVEFQNGYTLNSHVDNAGNIVPARRLMGMFLGHCWMQNDCLHQGKMACPTVGIQVPYNGDPYIALHEAPEIEVNKYFERPEDDEFQHLLIAVAVYLWFVFGKRDCINVALFPKAKNGVQEYYEVTPIPFADSIPNQTDPNSLITAGLASSLGFLSRKKFVESLKEVVEMTKDGEPYFFHCSPDEKNKERLNNLYRNTISKAILWWEHYRVIYQYSVKGGLSFFSKYLDDLLTNGLPGRLLKYMPHDTLVLQQLENNKVGLVSVCECINSQGCKIPGIAMCLIGEHDMPMNVYPADTFFQVSGLENDTATFQSLEALCVLCHILSVLEKRALKRLTKNTLTAGNPNTTALVPVEAKVPPKYIQAGKNNTASIEDLYRFGDTIEEIPFELFKITDKSVTRQQQNERKIKMGWKMEPHVRRPHPHRYWVGHGANKHMEVRWLDRIQVHKDQITSKSVIHRVR